MPHCMQVIPCGQALRRGRGLLLLLLLRPLAQGPVWASPRSGRGHRSREAQPGARPGPHVSQILLITRRTVLKVCLRRANMQCQRCLSFSWWACYGHSPESFLHHKFQCNALPGLGNHYCFMACATNQFHVCLPWQDSSNQAQTLFARKPLVAKVYRVPLHFQYWCTKDLISRSRRSCNTISLARLVLSLCTCHWC
jgi:hypothetical protein